MKLIGRLNLSEAKNEYADYDDYIMMCKGRNTNLTRLFYNVLLEDVHFSVGYANSKEKIIDVKGFLFKDKTNPEYYMFHVKQFNGELVNIDEILWNLTGCKLEINLKNITVESG